MARKISMVYYIASKLGKKVNYRLACRIAAHFSAWELDRIYRSLARRTSNVVGIGSKPSDLTGIGTEYLAPNGQVIAKFQDGHMITNSPAPNCDPNAITVVAAKL